MNPRLLSKIEISIFALLFALIILIWLQLFNAQQKKTQARQQAQHESAYTLAQRVQHELSNAMNKAQDLSLDLASRRQLKMSILQNSDQALFQNALKHDWITALTLYPALQQIRFLSNEGQEIFRVDQRHNQAVWIEEELLQNKKNRGYFQQALKSPEKVYLSRIDLNIENGTIEIPYRPTVRALSRVEDKSGTFYGFIVVNIDLTNEFNNFRDWQGTNQLWILDQNNNFLLGPNGNDWSAQVPPKMSLDKELNEIQSAQKNDQSHPTQVLLQTNMEDKTNNNDQYTIFVKPPLDSANSFDLQTWFNFAVGAAASLLLIFLGSLITKQIKKLRQTQKLALEHAQNAAKASRAKSEFLAHMSHEIRTPLNGVMGYLQLLDGENLAKRPSGFVRDGMTSLKLLSNIINDLLDFSKIEAEQLELTENEFEFDAMLRSVGHLMGRSASGKNINLWFDIDPKRPKILYGDEIRLQQILINLTNNAIKFTKTGSVVVTVKVSSCLNNQIRLKFSVTDTGIGMTQAQLERIFNPFQQASRETHKQFGGTGLGLAICKKLVELMDGHIAVTSTAGEGSCFEFDVALKLPKQIERTPAVTPDNMPILQSLILSADDQAHQIIKKHCETLGWSTSKVNSMGDLKHLEDPSGITSAGVVLLIEESVLDPGSEWQKSLTSWLKSALPDNLVKVLIISHNHNAQDPLMGGVLQLFDGHLVKPFTASSLYDTVLSYLYKLENDDPRAEQTQTKDKIFTGSQILVVEDNNINQIIASEILGGQGAQVEIAENGKVALQKLYDQPGKYDLVLMDMQMPVMNGIEATQKIRENPRFDNLPIVAMTANAMSDDRELCFKAGMQNHIAKPINIEDLIKTLKVYLT